MNLKEFTEIVDKRTEEMQQEDLRCFVHSIARKVPEKQREEFAAMLCDFNKIGGKEETTNGISEALRMVDEKEIRRESDRLNALFQQIQDEELCLYAEGYEDYSQGYWDNDWVWEYEDPNEVCRIYEDAVRLIQRCMNDGFYKTAQDLFDLMMKSEVYVESDEETFSMNLQELQNEKLVDIDLNLLALSVLYAVYQAASPETRAQELYGYFSIPFFRNVKLEQMLSLGREELKGLPEFWDSWIKLLSSKGGDMEGRLLKEAVLCYKGEEGILELARISYEKHPSLYLEAIRGMQKLHDDKRLLEIGKEALEKIEKGYVLRSEIALSTAEAALRLQQEDYAQQCWLEAFESHTTPINYLRIAVESSSEQYEKAAKRMILAGKIGIVNRSSFPEINVKSDELKRNGIFGMDMTILKFLSGDFEYAERQCSQTKQALGWSGTFMKTGIALFLLLIYQGEELQSGCQRQLERVVGELDFDGTEYFKGTRYAAEYGKRNSDSQDDSEVFWQCMKRWKAGHVLSEEQIEGYLAVLEPQIDKRVKAIVSGQHRKHYESVAALAAALGEVKESLGAKGAKEETLQSYRMQFPKHSSFHAALRANGMTDKRKK